MKTKITLLLVFTFMMTSHLNAETRPTSSEKKSPASHQALNQKQLPSVQLTGGVVSILECGTSVSFTDNVLLMPDNIPAGVTAALVVSGLPISTLGSDVYLTKVHIAGNHTWVGDIKIALMAPNGTTDTIISRPGYTAAGVGCANDGFSFDIIRGTGHDNETACNVIPPAISGVFTGAGGDDLNNINLGGGDPNGTWTLFASDNAAQDTGGVDTLIMYFAGSTSVFTYTLTNTTAYFTAPGVGGTVYGWNFGDGNVDVGSSVSNTYATAGSYTVTMAIATLSDTCTTSYQVNPTDPVGIPAVVSSANNFIIAPNPSTGIVDLSFKEISSANAMLTVRDSYGRILKTEALKSGSYHQILDISQWSKGIYFVEVMDKNQTKVQKLVLK